MARVWLDATVDEQEVNASAWRRPPVPSIPEAEEQPQLEQDQHQLLTSISQETAPHTPVIPSRRRRSMPPRPLSHLTVASSSQDSTSTSRKRTSINRRSQLRRDDDNDDVISSLVASLAHDSLQEAPSTNNTSPYRARELPALRKIRSQESGLRDSASNYGSEAGFDNAAIPPVIKTAPPPSGLSPITAPKAKGSPIKSSFFKMGSKAGSRTSLVSQSPDDGKATHINVDSLAAGLAAPSVAEAVPSDIPRVDPRRRGLTPISSHERMRELAAEHKRAMVDTDIDTAKYLYPPSPRVETGSSKKKHDSSIDDPELAFSRFDSIPGFRAMGKRPVKDSEAVVELSPTVPKRQSSLARTEGSSLNSGKGRRSTKSGAVSSRSASYQSEVTKLTVPELDTGRLSEELRFEDVEDIDTDVVKRIKELKAKRELRALELNSLEPPTLFLSQLGDTSRDSSRSRSPAARHIRSASDPEKDDKWLAVQPLTLHRTSSANDLHGAGASFGLGVRDEESRHDAPRTPPTPPGANASLPIDYSYVLKALEQGPASRQVSAKASLDGRAVENLGVNGSKALDAFDSSSRRSDRRSFVRNSSEDPPSGQFKKFDDILVESSPPAKIKKKKRWSQSDIHFSEKGDSQKSSRKHKDSDSLAVRSPDLPSTLSEERPSTSDSVDGDVSQFVHAGRLTQKIRHPQNGRTIAFSEVGDPTGHAVFCCVGMGLTRYITAFYDELAKTLKLRLITPDRPGVGGTQSDPTGTPLSWPDDVIAICQALHITKFSIMAHSAGAVYALATALRVPQHIRGKVHLLAPWIPPSQMTSIGLKEGSAPTTQLPKSQRLLRALPTPFLKVANSGFMTATSASLSPNNSPRQRRKTNYRQAAASNYSPGHTRNNSDGPPDRPNMGHARRESIMLMDQNDMPSESALSLQHKAVSEVTDHKAIAAMTLAEQERRKEYDARLTLAIWDMATTNANPAVDLLVCLERTQPIGFRYVDINRSVVIHHGSKDTRVPVENVKWLGRTMRKCEVRILDGEGHGLMASAAVMGSVLTEMAMEWDEWDRYTVQKGYERKERRDMFVGTVGLNGNGSGNLELTTVG